MTNGLNQKEEQKNNEEKFWLLVNAFNRDWFSLLWKLKENPMISPVIIETIIDQLAKVIDSGWGEVNVSIAEKNIIMIYGRQSIKVKKFNPGQPDGKEDSQGEVTKVSEVASD